MLAACSGLGGEPRIVATAPPRPTSIAAVDSEISLVAADLSAGQQIFRARCTSCHGPDGAGDGELVITGQVPPPPSFLDPATAYTQTPVEWFDTITQGRIDTLMPPWGAALNAQERWDVALYTYTLHITSAQRAQGAALWQAQCAVCHGADGAQQGRIANVQRMTTISDAALADVTLRGHDVVPAFAPALNDEELQAVVAYTRLLSLGSSPAPPQVAQNAVVDGSVSGQISNGTAGGLVPTELPVTLFIFDAAFNAERREAISDGQGRYQFTDVPLRGDYAYAVGVAYQSRLFTSEFARGEGETLDLPVTIHEVTDDPSVLTITDISGQITPVSGGVQIVELVTFENRSDRMFSTGVRVGENLFVSALVPLPANARIMLFAEDEGRYIVDEALFVVADTVPVMPGGPHTMRVTYFLPAQAGVIHEQPMEYALDGPVQFFVHPNQVLVVSEQLTPSTFDASGMSASYGTFLALNPGEMLRFELRPMPSSGSTGGGSIPLYIVPLIFGGMLLCVAGLVRVGYYVYSRPGAARGQPTASLTDALIQQIAELDQSHERGEIDTATYDQRRAQLKARLVSAMRDEKPAP